MFLTLICLEEFRHSGEGLQFVTSGEVRFDSLICSSITISWPRAPRTFLRQNPRCLSVMFPVFRIQGLINFQLAKVTDNVRMPRIEGHCVLQGEMSGI